MTRNNYKKLLVDKELNESESTYKYAVLRGQLGFLLGAICLAYVFIDWYNNVTVFIPLYLLVVVFSVVIIILNRKGFYSSASFLLLLISNLLVYLFAAVDIPESGVFFFFVTTTAMAPMLYYPDRKFLMIFFMIMSISLALIAFFEDWSPIPPPAQGEDLLKINFIINFTMGISSTLLILLFFIKRNKDSEGSLIASRKELEKVADELELSQRRFKMAVEGSRAGIYEWNLKTQEVFVSVQWMNLLGYTKENCPEVTFEFFLSLVHPEDLEKTNSSVQYAIANSSNYQNELRMRCSDGDYKYFLDSGIVSADESGNTFAVGSILDISDRKSAEYQLIDKNRELQKINTELDRFVYSASHDMRAPLSTLLGLLQLAKITNDPKELSRYFEMMTDRIYTMEGFIREVTDYSRNARLDTEYTEVDLKALTSEVLDSFELLASEARVEFRNEIDLKEPVYTDEVRMRVILNNLISNAVKYHDKYKEYREVTVKAKKDRDLYYISVVDNGVGILEKYKDRIFEMFFRASERSDGSGLGLYIVRETLERLDGEIRYEPVEGGGSAFHIQLPVGSKKSKKSETANSL